jgi:hypothetical protein
MPTEEQKDRKNEMRRLNRARKKEVISKEEPQEPQEEPQEPQEEPQEPQEDPEVIRKKIIADKRRASLALARTKIKTNSQNTKDEITKVKEENIQLKELAKKKEVEVKPVIPEIVPKVKKQRPKKVQVQQVQQVQHEPSIDYLVDKSYGEKLQTRLRDNMLQRMMQDTFM